VPEAARQLAEHDVALLHAARGMELRRYVELWIRHRRDADEVDEGGAAFADVGALDEIAELALGHAGPRAGEERGKARVAERSADAQPVELLLRLDEPQAHVLNVELHEREFLFQLALLAREQRAHEADALRAALFQLGNGERHAAMLAPAHVAIARQALCQREVIEPFDVHGAG